MAERHTVEKAQVPIQRRPGYPDRHQVYLEGANILPIKTIEGPTDTGSTSIRGKVRIFASPATDCGPSGGEEG